MLRVLFHQAAGLGTGKNSLKSYEQVSTFLDMLSSFGYISTGDKSYLLAEFKKLTPPFSYEFVKIILSWLFQSADQDLVEKTLNYGKEISSRLYLQQEDSDGEDSPISGFAYLDTTTNDRSTQYDWNQITEKIQEKQKSTSLYTDPTVTFASAIDLCELEQGVQNYLTSLILASDRYTNEDTTIAHFITCLEQELKDNQTQFGEDARRTGLVAERSKETKSRNNKLSDDCVLNLFWNKLHKHASFEVCFDCFLSVSLYFL